MKIHSLILCFFLCCTVLQPANCQAQGADTVATQENTTKELPTVTPYFLAHQYLSVLAPNIKDTDGHILESPYILNTYSAARNGFVSPYSDGEIEVTHLEHNGKDVYIWKFPEPKHLREPLYIAFIPVDGHYMAFAISIGQMVDWEISTSSKLSRSTYGRIKRPDNAAECFELLEGRGAFNGQITPGDFFSARVCSPRTQIITEYRTAMNSDARINAYQPAAQFRFDSGFSASS